jgi:hypothetical protein
LTLEARIMAHLAIGGQANPAPPEWIAHVLCDRYKWPLEYVRALPLPDTLALLTVLSAEGKVAKTKHG